MMEGETTNEVTLRRAQLERISFLVEKASRSEFEEKKTEAKKCNFYNRGFCNRGSACKFVHPPEVCEDYEGSGICGIRRCQKRHLYSCKYVNSEVGCARGEACNFSHRNKPKVLNQLESETESIEVDLVDTSQEDSKTKRLGVGKFGWVARMGDSAVSVKAPDDQQLLSEKLKGAHLLLNKENVLEEEKKENRNDDDEVEQEKDVYDKLLEAMENGNEELKEEMMDQMLEEFDRLEKSKTDKKCLEKKKFEPKKLRKKKGLGTKVKGRGR